MSLVTELNRGIDLIGTLDDLCYRRGRTASVGAQFRHNLDFAVCLLRGLPSGHIDYTERERDTLVETDRDHAVMRFKRVIDQLSDLEPGFLGRSVLIRSEIEWELWLPSSVAREVEFVHSHTVHHHALIAEKLASDGIETSASFGVAPSTLEFWNRKAVEEKIMSSKLNIISWICRIVVAIILFQTLFFKFTGAEESKYIFSTLMGPELEAYGRIGSGVVELIAVILLLIPGTAGLGALLALGTISGAIMSHLTILGIVVKDDGGLLFFLAVTVFVLSSATLLIHRRDIPVLGSVFSNSNA